MDVQIKYYEKEGYKPVVDFNCWRVAYYNSNHNMKKEEITYLEKHLESDEIFVLLEGKALLITGGKKDKPSKPKIYKMEKNKVYNVKKGVWHTVLMKKNTKILIVENKNTSKKNSEYFNINRDYLKYIKF